MNKLYCVHIKDAYDHKKVVPVIRVSREKEIPSNFLFWLDENEDEMDFVIKETITSTGDHPISCVTFYIEYGENKAVFIQIMADILNDINDLQKKLNCIIRLMHKKEQDDKK